MNQITTINNTDMIIKEYQGQRVVTFKDIDKVHSRPTGTAKRNFKENRDHLIENTDFYTINLKDENRTLGISIPNRGVIVLTESGYLLLVKSFNDDLAWQVQRQLVNTYFKAKEMLSSPQNIDVTAAAIMQQNQLIVQMLSNHQEQNQAILSSISNQQIQAQVQTQSQLTAITNLITLRTEPQYEPQFTYWLGKTYKKRDTLAEYNGITKTEMLHSLYNELQDTYDDIDLNECRYEYCFQHGIPDNKLYTMNAIGADTKLKHLFDLMINTRLEQMDQTDDKQISDDQMPNYNQQAVS